MQKIASNNEKVLKVLLPADLCGEEYVVVGIPKEATLKETLKVVARKLLRGQSRNSLSCNIKGFCFEQTDPSGKRLCLDRCMQAQHVNGSVLRLVDPRKCTPADVR